MATRKRPVGKPANAEKRVNGISDSNALGSIFDAGASDLIPGEIIIQLSADAAASVTESIPRRAMRGPTGATTASFGVQTIDQALAQLNVTSVTRLHPPAPKAISAKTSTMALSSVMTAAVSMGDTFRVTFDKSTSVEQAANDMAQVEGVLYAEPNRYRETMTVPNDPSFASQWGLSKINAPAAWDRTTGTADIVVAVIDTGIDLNHPELAPLLVPGFDMVNLGPTPVPPAGFRFEGDFQVRDATPQDEVGHGTHVAGTIACLSNNSRMVAGVTWNCRLMPVKVLTRIVRIANPTDVRGTGSAADIAAGIRFAVDNGARVLNLSLGGTTDTQVERDAIAYAIGRGAVVCAAMGNGGAAAATSFPAAYPGVVAVGAIDIADQRAGFSQIGPHIDVVAPGVDILSTVWNDSTATMSGTSMACPHVAGVAALVLSVKPTLTGVQAADILRQTARPLRANPSDPVPNNQYGFGCVDALAAVNRARPANSTTISCQVVTTPVRCGPTREIACTTPIRCLNSAVVNCRPSVPTVCRPSTTILCPRPSTVIRCPSTVICGQPGLPGNPVEPGSWQGQGDDASAASSAAAWTDADPYAGSYEDDDAG